MRRTPAHGAETVTVSRRRIEISHPDKALFGDPVVTKRELARYYEAVGPAMVTHLRDRPLALEVFPHGVSERGFYVKRTPPHFPEWLRRVEVPKRGGSNSQVVADTPATLVFLAGQNVVTMHTWLSRADALGRPDRLVIDLDPSPGVAFAEVRAAARETGARLSAAGLVPFAMVTGSRGIHVVSPIRRGPEYPAVHAFARGLAEAMVAADPDRLTLEWHRDERGQRIYLDVNRNAYAQHVVAPYAVRARRGAPVAMPIEWSACEDPGLRPDGWSVATAARHLADRGDAWAGMSRRARSLPRRVGGV